MSKMSILHNNNGEKLLRKYKKNSLLVNNRMNYLFFILNEFVDFSGFV